MSDESRNKEMDDISPDGYSEFTIVQEDSICVDSHLIYAAQWINLDLIFMKNKAKTKPKTYAVSTELGEKLRRKH